MNALYFPTLFRCSFSNLKDSKFTSLSFTNKNFPLNSFPEIMKESRTHLKKFQIPRRMISNTATMAINACLWMNGASLKPNTDCIQASRSKTFSTLNSDPKYNYQLLLVLIAESKQLFQVVFLQLLQSKHSCWILVICLSTMDFSSRVVKGPSHILYPNMCLILLQQQN